MTGHERIRSALVALLQTVPSIGTLHNYERFSKNQKDFQELYLQDQNIRGFYLRRQSWREITYSSTRNKVRTRWTLKGFASLVDANATELTFDVLLDNLAAALRAKPVLFDTNDYPLCHTVTDDGAGLQLDDSGPVMFAGVLCHSATFTLTTEHLEEKERFISDLNAAPTNNNSQNQKDKQGTDPDRSQGSKGKHVCCPFFQAAIDPTDITAPVAELTRTFVPEGENNE